jgi:hypothetical protein
MWEVLTLNHTKESGLCIGLYLALLRSSNILKRCTTHLKSIAPCSVLSVGWQVFGGMVVIFARQIADLHPMMNV